MYLAAMDRLDEGGYTQYEISNVARRGCESRHNLKYWSEGGWTGFGCGAHSTRGGRRWRNLSSTEEYIATVAAGGHPRADERLLSTEERLEERLFMGLRLTQGVDLGAIEREFGVDVWARHQQELEPFLEARLLIYDSRLLRLTRAGMLLANEIMRVFISPTVR
jgi:oxygen-independent coproporphyrinogen-3 oxidase